MSIVGGRRVSHKGKGYSLSELKQLYGVVKDALESELGQAVLKHPKTKEYGNKALSYLGLGHRKKGGFAIGGAERKPSKWNMFVKKHMKTVLKQHPNMTPQEAMSVLSHEFHRK